MVRSERLDGRLDIPEAERGRSLAALFEDLGINNLVLGRNVTPFRWEWKPVELSELDDRLDELEGMGEAKFLQSAKRPDDRGAVLTSGNIYSGAFRDLTPPSVIGQDGATYTFNDARYVRGKLQIGITVERMGEKPVKTEYTAQELRVRLSEEIYEVERKQGIQEYIFNRSLFSSSEIT